MEQIFFGGWSSLIRTLIVGVLAYVVLVVFLRISGNRTLSKLNAFDLVVTVALVQHWRPCCCPKAFPWPMASWHLRC